MSVFSLLASFWWIFKVNLRCEIFHNTIMDEEAAGSWCYFTGVQCGFYVCHALLIWIWHNGVVWQTELLVGEEIFANWAGYWKVTWLFWCQTLKTGMLVMIWMRSKGSTPSCRYRKENWIPLKQMFYLHESAYKILHSRHFTSNLRNCCPVQSKEGHKCNLHKNTSHLQHEKRLRVRCCEVKAHNCQGEVLLMII